MMAVHRTAPHQRYNALGPFGLVAIYSARPTRATCLDATRRSRFTPCKTHPVPLLLLVMVVVFSVPGIASAHNEGHLANGDGTCVDVGSGGPVPGDAPLGGTARGVHLAIGSGMTPIMIDPC